jgi:hypothetical protein
MSSAAARLGGRGPALRVALAVAFSLGAGLALLRMTPSSGSTVSGAGADESAVAAAVLPGDDAAGAAAVVAVRRMDGPARGDVCHTHLHADYAGDMAVVWGMNFRVDSAAACCDACQAHARVCGAPDGHGKDFFEGQPHPCGDTPANTCNMWVYCAGGGAEVDNRCFSFDIHNHTQGECWLKRQADPSRPTVGDSGAFPPEMRAAPRQIWPWAVERNIWPWDMPEAVHWVSGVLLPEGADGEVVPGAPNNFVRWCDAHGPCADLPPSAAAAAAVA